MLNIFVAVVACFYLLMLSSTSGCKPIRHKNESSRIALLLVVDFNCDCYNEEFSLLSEQIETFCNEV